MSRNEKTDREEWKLPQGGPEEPFALVRRRGEVPSMEGDLDDGAEGDTVIDVLPTDLEDAAPPSAGEGETRTYAPGQLGRLVWLGLPPRGGRGR